MERTAFTRGEMERSLSQYIQAFYRNQLGCRTGKISCHLLNNKLAIVIENSITPVEKLLNESDEGKFLKDLRDRIDALIKAKLPLGMEEILQVKVIDLTIDTTLNHNFTGIIALLSQAPAVRNNRQAVYPNREQ